VHDTAAQDRVGEEADTVQLDQDGGMPDVDEPALRGRRRLDHRPNPPSDIDL
jgi:hypothetical protein